MTDMERSWRLASDALPVAEPPAAPARADDAAVRLWRQAREKSERLAAEQRTAEQRVVAQRQGRPAAPPARSAELWSMLRRQASVAARAASDKTSPRASGQTATGGRTLAPATGVTGSVMASTGTADPDDASPQSAAPRPPGVMSHAMGTPRPWMTQPLKAAAHAPARIDERLTAAKLERLAEKIASCVAAYHGTRGRAWGIRLRVAESILPGTDIAISSDDHGHLSLCFTCEAQVVADRVARSCPELVDALHRVSGRIAQVDVRLAGLQ